MANCLLGLFPWAHQCLLRLHHSRRVLCLPILALECLCHHRLHPLFTSYRPNQDRVPDEARLLYPACPVGNLHLALVGPETVVPLLILL